MSEEVSTRLMEEPTDELVHKRFKSRFYLGAIFLSYDI
jgi:hypothetical protein